MKWIKLFQSLMAYTAGIFYAFKGESQLGYLCFIVAVLCDIGYILEDKK